MVCYTDGSASPNPGPAGSGAVICLPGDSNGLRIDLGAALGHGTNNLAEVYAVGVCLQVLLRFFPVRHFRDVAVFTDSKYVLSVLSSRSNPTSNVHAVLAVRSLLRDCSRLFLVSLRWLKGHVGIPGNALADSIAGHFASVSARVSHLPPQSFTMAFFSPLRP
ncbi:MAG: RNAse HI domain-containing protein, partial [Thaumarchaeota archaeon]|nr:RNAse HI domain-containing protein [Nitrososphaerota archaeon]